MKTINVSQAEGPVLDWLVCKALGIRYIGGYAKSWRHCGPIIEREGIWTRTTDEGEEDPSCLWRAELPYLAVGVGPTLLIAAMRCFCCSKLGETVEVPEELT